MTSRLSFLSRSLLLATVLVSPGGIALLCRAEPNAAATPAPAPLPPKRNIAGPGDYGIREKLVHLISIDEDLKRSKIEVVLVNGGAFFSGEIKNCALKKKLLTIGGLMRGVVNVTDEVAVPRGNVPDEELAKSVRKTLDDIAETFELKGINVRVEDGVLTMEGTVKNMVSRSSVEDYAGAIEGITRISNHLEPADAPTGTDDDSLQKAVIAYLSDFHSYPYRSDLTVKVKDMKVTLKGRAALYMSRQQAALSASMVHGVEGVDNRVKVDPSVVLPASRVVAEK